ncbi:MAG: hypothetical protein QG639_731 [Patescibacteria group bacterium]|nr:hypothetical protein [Patescibacteria group bacterium]
MIQKTTNVIASIFIFLLVFTLLPSYQQIQAAEKPNIVVIMTDDLDVTSMSVLLAQGWMPNVQQHIISKGTTFQSSFVNNSLCCPSRATFLTGQYTHNHNTYGTGIEDQGVSRFNDTSTLATWLQSDGYSTSLIGKYINGYALTDLTGDGVLDINDAQYIPPGWDDWQGLIEPYVYRMYYYAINENGTITSYGNATEDYQTDVLAQKAAQFIENEHTANPDKPLFLYLAPTAPHTELWPNTPFHTYTDVWKLNIQPPQRYNGSVTVPLPIKASYNEADLSDKPAWLQAWPLMTSTDNYYHQYIYRNRLAATRAIDDMVGTVVAALSASSDLDNTVFVFTSDNGFMLGEHRLSQKGYAFEEAIRVPLYIAAPGYPQNKVAQNQLVVNTDLAPTLLDLAEVTPGHTVDGTSLTYLLANNTIPWRKRFLIEHKLGGGTIFDVPTYNGVRTSHDATYVPNQVYIEYEDAANSREFYDLPTDPFQMNSLHAATSSGRTTQRSIHKSYLDYLKTCVGSSCQIGEFHNPTVNP